ncbi:MAG: PIN domain-containing protein [Myxococcales bacterium]|nr:PIN domain-containing protein [Myxococcales bacterium]
MIALLGLASVVAADERVALTYGRLFAELRAAGTPIPINDVWIAASALVAAAHLLTFDGDFARVPGLSCSVLSA